MIVPGNLPSPRWIRKDLGMVKTWRFCTAYLIWMFVAAVLLTLRILPAVTNLRMPTAGQANQLARSLPSARRRQKIAYCV